VMTVYHDLKKTLRALTRLIVMTCATLGLQGVILASLIGLRVKARKLNGTVGDRRAPCRSVGGLGDAVVTEQMRRDLRRDDNLPMGFVKWRGG
jgi:hypothetical protein